MDATLAKEGPHPNQVLSAKHSVRLGPSDFARIALHLEVFMALRPAESEDLRRKYNHHNISRGTMRRRRPDG